MERRDGAVVDRYGQVMVLRSGLSSGGVGNPPSMASAAPPQVDGAAPVNERGALVHPSEDGTAASSEEGASSRRRHALITLVIAACAAGAAVAINRWLFPLYSANRDDHIYVAMAKVLRHGHVTLAADEWPFRPWATGLVDGHIVFKYAPPWPSVLALGDILGSTLVGLGLSAAAAVVAVRALALEVVRDRTTALVATVLLVCSPVFLVQSGTYLPYLFSLTLGAASSALLLNGVRTASAVRLGLGGAVAGVALFARPFDAALLLVPVVIAVLVTSRRTGSVRANALAMAAGVAPLLALDLAYNWLVLGSPFKLPFSVTGSADAFGFGHRGVFESSTLPFDFGDGLSGAGVSLQWLPSWLAGGPVLVALGVWGLIALLREAPRPARWAVASWIVIVPVAYVFFWGPWAMTHNWDGVQMFGPFYHLPIVVPAVVFGAHGLRMLAARSWSATGIILAVMVAFTVWSLPDKIDLNQETTDQYRAVQRAVDRADLHDAILFLPLRGDGGFLSITPFLEYDPGLDAPVLYAEDCGTSANLAVLDDHPGRDGYRLELVDDERPTDADSYAVVSISDDAPTRRVDCPK
ncbi:MAG TPA: hypothetical protein VF183_11515 [Acidimicrobiales bacterium]